MDEKIRNLVKSILQLSAKSTTSYDIDGDKYKMIKLVVPVSVIDELKEWIEEGENNAIDN